MKKTIKLMRVKALLLSAIIFTYSCAEKESFYEENLQELSVTNATVSTTSTLTIEAEDFDVMSGVRTESTSDADGGINVGWIDEGDYLEYEIDVPASGTYQFDFRVASKSETSKAPLQIHPPPEVLYSIKYQLVSSAVNPHEVLLILKLGSASTLIFPMKLPSQRSQAPINRSFPLRAFSGSYKTPLYVAKLNLLLSPTVEDSINSSSI